MLNDVEYNDKSVNLAEMSDLQRPNLLDNADFKSGIINQRAFDNTTITGWSEKPTVDRWIFSGSGNATAEIDTDSMSISGDSYLIQTLSQQCQPGIYTVATNITELTGTLEISLVYSDDTSIDETVSGTGLFIHTFETTKSVKSVMFRCVGASSSFTFDSIKLEKGSVFTGMPQWNETIELLKCMRYFQYLDINETIWSTQYDNPFEQNIMFMLPMIKTPSITTDMTDNYNVTNVSVVAKDKNRCSLRYTLDNSIGNGHRIGLRINADAETYKGGIIYGRF